MNEPRVTIHKEGCAVFTMTDDCNTGKCNCGSVSPSEPEKGWRKMRIGDLKHPVTVAYPSPASHPGEAPTFAELKELPKLRELAKMVTESPCFTNAILAGTDAYKEGLKARK